MDKKIIEVAVILIVVPIAVGVIINAATGIVNVTANLIEKIRFNSEIKKGLKNGSIVDINGEYFEVIKDNK